MEFLEDKHLELYNLEDDLGESKNLAEQMPEKTKELHAKLVAWRKAIQAPMPTPNEPKDVVRPKKAGGQGKGKKQRARVDKKTAGSLPLCRVDLQG